MKRPLAFVGALYFATQLLAAFVPQAALGPLAAFFGCILLFVLLYKPFRQLPVALLFGTVLCALLLRIGYIVVVFAPVCRFAGEEAVYTGIVEETQQSYQDGMVNAVVCVTSRNEKQIWPQFRMKVELIPEAMPGEAIAFTAKPQIADESSAGFSFFAKGVFLHAQAGKVAFDGTQHSVRTLCTELRTNLGTVLRKLMSREIGGIAAAICLGDKSGLTSQVQEAFRSAGLSHALVVSGLHLSIISGGVYSIMRRVLRRKYAALCGIFATLAFMLLAGMTPSLVRAGTAMILLFAGMLCSRKSDSLTSLAFSALLLTLANPYAAVDVGLLLSYSAVLGVLAANAVTKQILSVYPALQDKYWPADKLLFALLIPVSTTLCTLPVLTAIGSGVSLLSVVCNLAAAPLFPLLTGSGLLAACIGRIGWLRYVAQLCGFLCGTCTKLLYGIALLAQKVPWATVSLSGAVALFVVLGTLFLLWYGWKLRLCLRRQLACVAFFVLLCAAGYAALDARVARIAVVGQNANPALVVTQGLSTAVIYRGAESNVYAVKRYLRRYNRNTVNLVVDLRKSGDANILVKEFAAEKLVVPETDVINHTFLKPFYGIIIGVYHQENGNYACVNANNYTVGVAGNKLNMEAYPEPEIYLAGSAVPENLRCGTLLLPRMTKSWSAAEYDAQRLVLSAGEPMIALRVGSAVQLMEVEEIQHAQ